MDAEMGFELMKAWLSYGLIVAFLLMGIGFFIHYIATSCVRITTLARIVSLAPGTAESIRNFATLPNMNAWNANRQNVGFPPDIREFVEVQVNQKGKWKSLRLYPSKHFPAEQLRSLGKAGDYIRITYRGNKLISFVRLE